MPEKCVSIKFSNLFHIKYICEHIIWSGQPDDPPGHLLEVPEVVSGPLPHHVHLGLLPQAGGGRHVASGGEGGHPPPGAPSTREAWAVHTRNSGQKIIIKFPRLSKKAINTISCFAVLCIITLDLLYSDTLKLRLCSDNLFASYLFRLDVCAVLGSVFAPENPFSALTKIFSVRGSVLLKVFGHKISNSINECKVPVAGFKWHDWWSLKVSVINNLNSSFSFPLFPLIGIIHLQSWHKHYVYSRLFIKVLTLFVLCECFLWLGLLSLREAITRAEPEPWLDRDRDTQPRQQE